MKVCHVCHYCDAFYQQDELEGPDQIFAIRGVCRDCAEELGFSQEMLIHPSFYH